MAKSSRKRRRPFISSQKNAHTAHSKVSLLSIFCTPLKLFPQWTFHSLKLSSITDGLFQFKRNRLYSLVDSFESFSAPSVFSLSALYTLTSVFTFSILFIHTFPKVLTRRIFPTIRASVVGDHFIYSHDLYLYFRDDIIRRS